VKIELKLFTSLRKNRDKKYKFEYTILPVVTNNDCMSISNQYKAGTKIDAKKLKK
jgi:hypothetical protein